MLEVFVTLWLKQLVAAARRPDRYLFTIFHNCIYSHFRMLALEHQLKSKLVQKMEESENQIVEQLHEKEKTIIVENMISQMALQRRFVYKLAKQKGLSREEIAQQLNSSPIL